MVSIQWIHFTIGGNYKGWDGVRLSRAMSRRSRDVSCVCVCLADYSIFPIQQSIIYNYCVTKYFKACEKLRAPSRCTITMLYPQIANCSKVAMPFQRLIHSMPRVATLIELFFFVASFYFSSETNKNFFTNSFNCIRSKHS